MGNPLDTGEDSSSGSEATGKRIEELNNALRVVEREFILTRKSIIAQLNVWKWICLSSLFLCTVLSFCLLCCIKFDEDWTWQIIYYTAIRVTIAGVVIALLSFCLKMLRTYLNLLENIRHKISVIRSMANLVGAGADETQRNLIYITLTEMIIRLGNIGILSNEDDIKQTNYKETLDKLLSLKNGD